MSQSLVVEIPVTSHGFLKLITRWRGKPGVTIERGDEEERVMTLTNVTLIFRWRRNSWQKGKGSKNLYRVTLNVRSPFTRMELTSLLMRSLRRTLVDVTSLAIESVEELDPELKDRKE